MAHKFLVLTVKKWLKSVYIYGSYRKIKTGISLFWTSLYIQLLIAAMSERRITRCVYLFTSRCCLVLSLHCTLSTAVTLSLMTDLLATTASIHCALS